MVLLYIFYEFKITGQEYQLNKSLPVLPKFSMEVNTHSSKAEEHLAWVGP
jgi:hypothetical protein